LVISNFGTRNCKIMKNHALVDCIRGPVLSLLYIILFLEA
jgi:hypothetical protein